MVLRFVVDVHTTCFGLHGHLQVCKIFYFLALKESASLLLLPLLRVILCSFYFVFVAFPLIYIFTCACLVFSLFLVVCQIVFLSVPYITTMDESLTRNSDL
jgi:hypothetical protein